MQAFDETVTEDSHHTTHTTLEDQASYETPSSEHISLEHEHEDLDMSNLTLSPSQSTPRAPPTQKPDTTTNFAEDPSPYEALRREVANSEPVPRHEAEPITPGKTSAFQDISMTPDSSPFVPPNAASVSRPSTTRKKTDPILHRVLDKNYRIAATPMTSQRTRYQTMAARNEITTPATQTRFAPNPDFSSSPLMPEAPQLNSEVFSSPIRNYPPSARKPRTPGVSIFTPTSKRQTGQVSAAAGVGGKGTAQTADADFGPPSATKGVWDSDSEDEYDLYAGHSPPKTFQFHVPQSRLLKTPAKEASKRIVDSLLQSAKAVRTPRPAGGGGEEGDQLDYELDPDLDLTGDIDYGGVAPSGKYDWEDEDEDVYGYGRGAEGRDDVTDSPSLVKGRGGHLGEMTF